MDPVTIGLLAGAGSGVLSKLFGGSQQNPARAARPYLEKIPGIGEQYYSPYVNRGEEANRQVGDLYKRLAMDPQAFLNEIMQGYKPTEGYQYKSKMAQDAAHNAAAAGGYVGGEYDQRNRAELANSLASQDMQQYIDNILGLQGAGISGLQRQGDYGYQASSGLADYLGNAYGNRAQLESSGRQYQNQSRGNMFGNMLQTGLSAAGMAAGAPGAGGQVAGLLGSQAGGQSYRLSPGQIGNFASSNNWGRNGWLGGVR